MCGKECYENISVSFQKTFDEINEFIEAGEIEVEGKTIKLEFFLGGDYKVITISSRIFTLPKIKSCSVHNTSIY